jgi:hypothetical protein
MFVNEPTVSPFTFTNLRFLFVVTAIQGCVVIAPAHEFRISLRRNDSFSRRKITYETSTSKGGVLCIRKGRIK